MYCVSIWNSLPAKTVTAVSLSSCKRWLHNAMSRFMYIIVLLQTPLKALNLQLQLSYCIFRCLSYYAELAYTCGSGSPFVEQNVYVSWSGSVQGNQPGKIQTTFNTCHICSNRSQQKIHQSSLGHIYIILLYSSLLRLTGVPD